MVFFMYRSRTYLTYSVMTNLSIGSKQTIESEYGCHICTDVTWSSHSKPWQRPQAFFPVLFPHPITPFTHRRNVTSLLATLSPFSWEMYWHYPSNQIREDTSTAFGSSWFRSYFICKEEVSTIGTTSFKINGSQSFLSSMNSFQHNSKCYSHCFQNCSPQKENLE